MGAIPHTFPTVVSPGVGTSTSRCSMRRCVLGCVPAEPCACSRRYVRYRAPALGAHATSTRVTHFWANPSTCCTSNGCPVLLSRNAAVFGPRTRHVRVIWPAKCSVLLGGGVHGWCPGTPVIGRRTANQDSTISAPATRPSFTPIDRPMRTMADLLRQGRFADEAMAMLTDS